MKKKLYPLLLFTLICQSVFSQKIIKSLDDWQGTEIQFISLYAQEEENIRNFINADSTAKASMLKKRGLGYILLDYRNECENVNSINPDIGTYELVEYINEPYNGFVGSKIPLYYSFVDDYPVLIFMDMNLLGANLNNPITERILVKLLQNRTIPLPSNYRYSETNPSIILAPPYRRSQRYYVTKQHTYTGPPHEEIVH